jgi:hypothetical protein
MDIASTCPPLYPDAGLVICRELNTCLRKLRESSRRPPLAADPHIVRRDSGDALDALVVLALRGRYENQEFGHHAGHDGPCLAAGQAPAVRAGREVGGSALACRLVLLHENAAPSDVGFGFAERLLDRVSI